MNRIKKLLLILAFLSVLIPSISHALNFGEYLGAGSGTTKLLLHLNGNSTDSSGNANNGTDTAVTYGLAYGKFGQGASFSNASGSEIAKSTPTGIPTGSTARTISLWMNPSALPTTGQQFGIISYGSAATRQLFEFGYDFATTPSDGFRIATYADDLQSSTVPSTGIWYNIIITYDGNVTLKLYINSVLDTTKTLGGTLNTGNTTIYVGRSILATGRSYSGSLDEVIIENRAWSATDVQKYYTYAKGRFGIQR